jgi:hypothetical protein
MSGGGANFPVGSSYSSGQPPDFFLPLSNIVKIYYKTGLDLAISLITLLIQKLKVKILSWLSRGKV